MRNETERTGGPPTTGGERAKRERAPSPSVTMVENPAACTFERLTDLGDARPTLIEGLPGLGLVAAIAVQQITEQLGLEHHGNIRSDQFPPVATFEDGGIVDTVRVYASADPPVMTLQSALPIPPQAFPALTSCALGKLATEFRQAIFLVGTPAQGEEELGQVAGLGTGQAERDQLEAAGIELVQGTGLIGGPTGALLQACYHQGIPAIALLVKAHPQLPDPRSAHALIENALEPLVEFDIDTSQLLEQAEDIEQQLEQVAAQYRKMQEQGQGHGQDRGSPDPNMYV